MLRRMPTILRLQPALIKSLLGSLLAHECHNGPIKKVASKYGNKLRQFQYFKHELYSNDTSEGYRQPGSQCPQCLFVPRWKAGQRRAVISLAL